MCPPTWKKLYDLPIVGDVRGEGYFYGVELVKDKATKRTFSDEERASLLPRVLGALRGRAVCRTDDAAIPSFELAPPLISGEAEKFDTIEADRAQRAQRGVWRL